MCLTRYPKPGCKSRSIASPGSFSGRIGLILLIPASFFKLLDCESCPRESQDGGAPFLTTHWSVVAACSDLGTGAAHAALTQLCRDYWPPLYSFVRRRGFSRADAQDLVQLLCLSVAKQGVRADGDATKGEFRSFLLASLKHYIFRMSGIGNARSSVAAITGLCCWTTKWMPPKRCMRASPSPRHWTRNNGSEKRWAATLVARALERLQKEFENGRRAELFPADCSHF